MARELEALKKPDIMAEIVDMKPALSRKLLHFETAVTDLSDSDSEWWPFLFLRPAPSQRLDTGRCALLSILHTLPAVLLSVIASTLFGLPLGLLQLTILLLVALGASFAVFRFVLAVFWNRRALRLHALAERRAAWERSSGGPCR